MQFIQLVNPDTQQAYLVNVNAIEQISPHSYMDKDGETYHGTIIHFAQHDTTEPWKAHFIHEPYGVILQKLMRATYILFLEGKP
jgi:hypothetical protein